jgi:protein-tyrosine phosphatase
MDRLRTQGLRTTLIWAYARGLPAITGIPIIKYSRITPDIYVGPQFRAAGRRRLESIGIVGSINLRDEYDDRSHYLDFKEHCYLPTVDDHAPTIAQLEQGILFIQHIIEGGGKVYIHCRGGIGRAPTMATAYLIYKGFELEDALNFIRESRPFIKIMPAQMQRLKELQATIRDKKTS